MANSPKKTSLQKRDLSHVSPTREPFLKVEWDPTLQPASQVVLSSRLWYLSSALLSSCGTLSLELRAEKSSLAKRPYLAKGLGVRSVLNFGVYFWILEYVYVKLSWERTPNLI